MSTTDTMETPADTTHDSGIVTCRLGDAEFGLDLSAVQEVVRYPRITPVPFAPPYVAGITNLRGNLLPVVDARTRFNLPIKERTDADRVVVVNLNGSPIGLVVDAVREVMHLGQEEYSQPPPAVHGMDQHYVRSVVRRDDGKRLILVLDHQHILDGMAIKANKAVAATVASTCTASGGAKPSTEADTDNQVVAFRLGDEEFALPIASVQEIIRVPEVISVPQAPGHVLGVANLRGRILPVVSLKTWYGMAVDHGSTVDERCVVAKLGCQLAAIKVDRVLGVLRLGATAIEPTPSLAGASGGRSGIRGVAKLDQGKRLVLILDPGRILADQGLDELTEDASKPEGAAVNLDEPATADERQLVSFLVGDSEFGIAIQEVQEIVRLNKVTKVPHAPDYVEGVTNLRGDVLPVIDLRKCLGLPSREVNDQTRVVVVDLEGIRAGLIVDAVREVMRVPVRNIAPAPELVTGNRREVVEGVARLDQGERMVLIMRPGKLLNREELKAVLPSPSL